MFERFTDASRRVVVYAQEESRARGDRRPDDGCTCGLDALLRDFPEPPASAAGPA
jgi:hypothetical protein